MTNQLKLQLDEYYNNLLKPDLISSYRISDCGPPWIGAMFCSMMYCHNLSIMNGYNMHISSCENWRMNPGGPYYDYFSGLNPVNDDQFAINDFTANNFKFNYTHRVSELNQRMHATWTYHPEFVQDIYTGKSKEFYTDIWKSYLLKRMFNMKPHVYERMLSLVDRLDLPEQYIGIHIRRGDKVAGPIAESKLIPVENYFNSFVNTEFNQINNVFIATDSDAVIQECVEKFGDRYNIFYDDTEIRNDGYPYKVMSGAITESADTVTDEFYTALKNIHILKNSQLLAGTRASWFFRVSQLLRDYDDLGKFIQSEPLDNIPGYPEGYMSC